LDWGNWIRPRCHTSFPLQLNGIAGGTVKDNRLFV
jgi:hypothetical protein